MKALGSHPRLKLCLLLPLVGGIVTTAAAAAERAAALDWSRAGTSLQGQRVVAERPNDKAPVKVVTARSSKGLFDLEDRTVIVIAGKATTAGAAKKAIHAEIALKAGPAKTVKGGARRLDLAALNVVASATRPRTEAPRTMGGSFAAGGVKAVHTAAVVPARAMKDSVVANTQGAGFSGALCLHKGPPKILEVAGRLKAGAKVTVWGECLGDRPGRVEIIGQFPGGRLVLPFTAWDMTGVDIEVPASIRGAADHVVALTIVTAEGKTTAAMQAQFVAARERVEVPDRLWSPGSSIELSSTTETLNTNTGVQQSNKVVAGQSAKSLRVNPQCALDDMDAVVLAGSISQIRGWEMGPPNEANVTIDWAGTCTSSTTTTRYNYVLPQVGNDYSVTSACRVAFQARAWAYCPAGIAP